MKVGNKIMTELNKMFNSDKVRLNDSTNVITVKELKAHFRKYNGNPTIKKVTILPHYVRIDTIKLIAKAYYIGSRLNGVN